METLHNKYKIRDEIITLINLRQEGQYWDFKREWHELNADLLHDIISMANNLDDRDAYIILGIDEENNYGIKSVIGDCNRKNTQKLVDFLRDKKFAGGIRPIIYVETVEIKKAIIDVIIIKNSKNTPFYLTERYQNVNANNIYTRIMDTNTPKDKSADIHHVEYLWRKRFHLISTPLERVKHYLEMPDEWVDSPTDWITVKKYHKFFPEFTIEHTLDDDGNAYQYYLFNQTNITPHWGKIRIFYHQTLLTELEGISLDGGRYFSPTPETDGISLGGLHNWDVVLKYFIIDTLSYTVHQFYYEPDGDDETISYNKFVECILFFQSDDEKELFMNFALSNWKSKGRFSKDIWLPHFPQIDDYIMEEFEKEYKNAQILKRMLVEFRSCSSYGEN